mmetsp:Transcript_11230/g.38256  ORF Transcript_11230/g.38256 Transcript_11230/m.38256 type:complete len:258 (+) Transcript_11230:2796-3569(+)
MVIRSRSPSLGVRCPWRISETPNRMGNLRSTRYDRSFLRMSSTTESEVATPSATSLLDAMMSSRDSPLPRRTPTLRFRDRGPKHVPNVSPTPERPLIVVGDAPMASASLRVSLQPRVTSAAIALVPRPRPSHMPAAIAITFFTAPPISTPTTSEDCQQRNTSEEQRSANSRATRVWWEAMTTAVACSMAISLANAGPDRNAIGCSSPTASRSRSHMRQRVPVSMPLERERMGTSGRMWGASSPKTARENCTGTAWQM